MFQAGPHPPFFTPLEVRMRKSRYMVLFVLLLVSVLAAQCAPAATTGTEAPAAKTYKLAAIFPGVITDADYNTLAYVGVTDLQEKTDIETAYSESVAVPDVDRVMREYIDGGFNIIWTHGGQFVNQTVELAPQFPDVIFIAEGDSQLENPPANLWFIDRNFHVGFYGIGALAARATKTGVVGYIGGVTLPFSYAEVHAIQQAITDSGLDGALKLGMFGVFEAVKAAPEKVLVTVKYTDKSEYAPDNYATALLYDFSGPLQDIYNKILAGETGGYYPLGFDTGVSLQSPITNVDAAVVTEVEAVLADLVAGKIEVVKDITEVK